MTIHQRQLGTVRCAADFALLMLVAIAQISTWTSELPADERQQKPYEEIVLDDKPVAYWRFSEKKESKVVTNAEVAGGVQLKGRVDGTIAFGQVGPVRPSYLPFAKDNSAVAFFGSKQGFFRIKDPGEKSVLDFDKGDSITIEAWIKPTSIAEGQHLYIIGKGRTNNPGMARDNQNYALRLLGSGGTARISFLFRSADNRSGERNDFHRWNSNLGFLPDDDWHHITVSYKFGDAKSIRGYVDGQVVTGKWDIGGATDKGPVVDNDEVWIGSSLGGIPTITFLGLIDEVAIYRTALDAKRVALRYQVNLPDPREAELADANVPSDAVLVEIHEGIPGTKTWAFSRPRPAVKYSQPSFAFVGVPKKYVDGLISDRTNPLLIRARTKSVMKAGEYQFLVRAKSAARFFVDGKLVAQTNFMSPNGSGHEAVPEISAAETEELYPLPPAHQEQLAIVELDDGEHAFRLEIIVGGQKMRLEVGEVCVAVARAGEPFKVVTATGASEVRLSDVDWLAHAVNLRAALQALNTKNRMESAVEVAKYWKKRHDIARRELAQLPKIELPSVSSNTPINNEIDRFISSRLETAKVEAGPLTDDYAFLRRVTLDTLGVIPSRDQIAAFLKNPANQRRRLATDRLLKDPRWADHWVSYWQDVLAENPGILKPKLNNTGPFRWWIHESFLDNKPMDQFVTELIMMRGSKYSGAPAGFAIATQNDVPMAAKAQIVAKAFLGLNMTCARCHDAPFHSYTQENLFNIAASFDRKTLTLPKSSTVPVSAGARKPVVEISLKPGAKIEPRWPFEEIASGELPDGVLRNATDPREQLAAVITSPRNQRFPQVIVNRLWQRLMGRGLVEPVDDWEGHEPSHPKLLDYLARELVEHGYDLKHVARLIFNSQAYQRQVRTTDSQSEKLWAGQIRRRMSAEQVVDSMFAAASKKFNTEMLTLDPEGRRGADTFLNLGAPTRAWQFTSLSNERDRPALALPMAQTIIDVLLVYGWRDSRPNPSTVRDETPTMLQPLTLANGVVGNRVATLSDDSAITEFALEDQTHEQLVDELFLQILSRPPETDERAMFVELLSAGFDDRRVEGAKVNRNRRKRNAVSWSNHLSAEATRIKLELERAARAGDPPTKRLKADWRERMEDAVWALLNSPEFVFVP